eukprot:GHRR01035047.1.p1 GENE.GHRR01035047.1~~GHRR01035047.1.p1  ORF type:complete len:206 (+),score=32.26 GHRR01035047.1:35-619(+)
MDKYKRRNDGKTRWLALIETCSRRVWGYVLKSESVTGVLDAYKMFLKRRETRCGQRRQPFINKFNNKKNIPTLTVVAKVEHVTHRPNPLGVLDSCVKTLRILIEKHIHLHNDAKWTQWLGDIIQQYNNMPHSTHKNKSPKIYGGIDAMRQRWWEDNVYNLSVKGAVASYFKPGEFVRVQLARGTIEKGGTQVWV